MINGLLHKKLGKRGFTLMEILVVVGIVAILAGIAIPSIISIKKALDYKRNNEYAKAIFLSVQANLTAMKENGEIGALQALIAESDIEIKKAMITREAEPEAELQSETDEPADETENADDSPHGYIVVSHDTKDLLQMVLPHDSIDASVREEHMIIELNPETGNVFSVFYWKKKDNSGEHDYRNLVNLRGDDEKTVKSRKNLRLGYYEGSFAVTEDPTTGKYVVGELDAYELDAFATFYNGQESFVRVQVPNGRNDETGAAQVATNNLAKYAEGLEIRMTIVGDNGGTISGVVKRTGVGYDTDLPPAIINDINNHDYNGITAVRFDFPIDSLMDGGSFANLSAGITGAITDIEKESDFAILPGENVSITVDVTYTPSEVDDPVVNVNGAAIAGVNPMFHSLTKNPAYTGAEGSTEKEYILAISNGRNLQNLNALAPSIASKVEAVVFVSAEDPQKGGVIGGTETAAVDGTQNTSDGKAPVIDWKELIQYYDGGSTANVKTGETADVLNFVPIRNPSLFGFDAGVMGETVSAASDQDYARIEGNGVEIRNLSIHAAENAGYTYVNGATAATNDFTGVFAYLDTVVEGIKIVNPVVTGAEATGSKTPATGALAGAVGVNTRITDCGVYIDTAAYDAAKLNLTAYTGQETLYGVSGDGAVGGLVGYARSNKVLTAADQAMFRNCFAAVPVYGDMSKGASGYTSGIGGLVGNAQMVGFTGCYASGNVIASGMSDSNAAEARLASEAVIAHLGIDLNGAKNWGAGGFVGTSHGAQYTDCFAVGNVTGETQNDDYGMGAFVGVMCYDSRDGIQRTVFSSCYALGEASATVTVTEKDENGQDKQVQRTLREGFSGGNAVLNPAPFTDSKPYANANYYLAYALSILELDASGTLSLKAPADYLFKDTYHLSRVTAGEGDELIDRYSSFCSLPDTYYNLQNLDQISPELRLNTLKDIVIASYVNSPEKLAELFAIDTPSTNMLVAVMGEYLSALMGDKGAYINLTVGDVLGLTGDMISNLEAVLLGEYRKSSFHMGNKSPWLQPPAETHPYATPESGAAYPFPVINAMVFYGDWPAMVNRIGLAYYEDYHDTTKSDDCGYYFDHPDASTLQNGVVSLEDGYALLLQDKEAISVAAYSLDTKQVTPLAAAQSLPVEDGTILLGKGAYHVVKLTHDMMKDMVASYSREELSTNYYIKLVVNGTDTFYFNPCVAVSQVNLLDEGKTVPETPETVIIRSARQLVALGEHMKNFWNLDYVQQTSVDFESYYSLLKSRGEEQTSYPIGSIAKPFTGSYTAELNGFLEYADRMPIYGHVPGINADDGTAGLFGVLGEDAEVKNLVLIPEQMVEDSGKYVNMITVAGSAPEIKIGLLAAVNHGTIESADVLVTDDLSLASTSSTKSMGLLAGENYGTLTNCEIMFADDRTNDANTYSHLVLAAVDGDVGMLVGRNSGNLISCSAADKVICKESSETGKPVGVSMIAARAGGLVGSSGGQNPRIINCSVAEKKQADATEGKQLLYCPADLSLSFAPSWGEVADATSGVYGGMVGYAANTTITNTLNLDSEATTARCQVNLGNVGVQLCIDDDKSDDIDGLFGGVVGEAVSTTLKNMDVTIGKSGFTGRNKPAMVTVSARTAAGLVAEATSLKLSNSSVDINGNLYGTELAAGAVGKLDWETNVGNVKSTSEIANVVVTLDRTALEYISTPAVDEIAPSNFEDARIRNVIKSDKEAAGFIGKSNGKVESCHVSGVGTIYGAERTAGFVDTVNGNASVVSGCSVGPAYYDVNQTMSQKFENNYLFIGLEPVQALNDSYSKQAAGFVAENYSDITGCRALGTVFAEERSAGFVLDNYKQLGVISFSFANVNNGVEVNNDQKPMAADRHMVFAASNSGYIKNSYGWATDGKLDSYVVSDQDTTDYYVSCYFAVMYAEPGESTVILYNIDGDVDPAVRTYLDLQSQRALDALLDTQGQGWSYAKDEAMKTYSYNMGNLKYPYPMIASHYGDWVEPVGVVYYGAVPAAIGSSVTTLEPGMEYSFNDSWDIGSYVFCGRGDENVTAVNASVSTTELSVGDDPAIYNAVGFISTDFKLYRITPYQNATEFTIVYDRKQVTVKLTSGESNNEKPEGS